MLHPTNNSIRPGLYLVAYTVDSSISANSFYNKLDEKDRISFKMSYKYIEEEFLFNKHSSGTC